jgi:hypothetical protein
MTDIVTRVPMTAREGECIMWMLSLLVDYPDRTPESETDALFVLLKEGFKQPEIVRVADSMFELAYGNWLHDSLTDLEKAILRVSVENTTWLMTYREKLPHLVTEAQKTLRSLATKFEAIGIDVNHIPND